MSDRSKTALTWALRLLGVQSGEAFQRRYLTDFWLLVARKR